MNFNQKNSHIIINDGNRVRVANLSDHRAVIELNGIPSSKIVKMYYTTNLIFYVTRDSDEDIMVIYDIANSEILNKIQVNNIICDINISKKYVSITTKTSIELYDLKNLINPLFKHEKVNNENFISDNVFVYIVNSDEGEQINIVNLLNNNEIKIKAHQDKIRRIAVNNNNDLIATASIKGTIIRIFDIITGEKKYEFRRGSNYSKINNMVFSADSKFLALLSDRNTIHIYNLYDSTSNRKSSLSILGGYFDSDWSFAWYYDNFMTDTDKVCCFDNNNDLIIITNYCYYHKISFNKKSGGECKLLKVYKL